MSPKPTLHTSKRLKAIIAVACTLLFASIFMLTTNHIHNLNKNKDHYNTALSEIENHTEPMNFLLVGSDSRRHTALYTGNPKDHAQVNQHADIITLLRIDPLNYKITLMSIPRDTVLTGSNQKINEGLMIDNPEFVVENVEKLVGFEIPYYVMTDYAKFVNLVDSFGGLKLDVPKKITVSDPLTAKDISLKAGDNQNLDGSQTLALARARKEYGDNQEALRQVNVRNIEKEIIELALNSASLDDAAKMLAITKENTYTNFNIEDFGFTLAAFIHNKDKIQFYSATGPYHGDINENGQWVIEEDAQAYEEIATMLENGINPEEKLPCPSF